MVEKCDAFCRVLWMIVMKKLNSIADRALMLLVACLFASTAIAQNKKPDRLDGSVIVNTDLVVTWAQITARNDGRAINGLVVDDFVLHEEGKRQKISLLKEGQPLSVVILVDGMACVKPPEIEFRRSHEALRQLAEDTEIALMAWDSDVRLVQAFTRDQNVIAERIENRRSARLGTP